MSNENSANNYLPLYQQIYNDIIEDIKKGSYVPGDKLPSEKELADGYDVSRITSKKALKLLSDDGYIKRIPGKGSFVLDEGEEKSKNPNYLVGLVIPDISESYGVDLLLSIEKHASKNNIFIVFKQSYGQQDIEEKAIDALLDLGVDGIIILPVHGEHYNPKILKLVLAGFPIVFIDRYLKGIPAPFVGTDNVLAANDAASHLIKLGHKNISIISPPVLNTSTIEDRIKGFMKSHTKNGLFADESIWLTNIMSTIPRVGMDRNISVSSDIEKIKNLLLKNPQITCLFIMEYYIALLAHESIKQIGKKVPDDISILCFDGPISIVGDYDFTHVQQNEEKMGVEAINLFIECISENTENKTILLSSELVMGKSTKKL